MNSRIAWTSLHLLYNLDVKILDTFARYYRYKIHSFTTI